VSLPIINSFFSTKAFMARRQWLKKVSAVDKPTLREYLTPTLENPTFIQGLPGFGNVGKLVAQMLINHTGAKLFAELYSPTFPDYVSVSTKGISYLPKYEFHYAKLDSADYVIMSGETQPSFDDVLAHYEISGEIVNYIRKLGAKFLITIGGVPVTEEKAHVYVAATSPRLAAEFMEKGAVIYSRGKIVGGTGLTLALAKESKLEGVCILGATAGFESDKAAASLVFKYLMKALGKEIKEGLPETQ
jgi:uncharacterized protein